MGIAPRKNLFRELSAACGVADTDSSMRFYYGLVKHIIHELKKNGQIQLPELGTFKLKNVRPKRYFNVSKQAMDIAPESKRITFLPVKKMKDFFKDK